MRLLTILPILLSACSAVHLGCLESWDCVDKTDEYEESRLATVDAWGQLIGHVSDRCHRWVEKTRVVESEIVFDVYGIDSWGLANTYMFDGELADAEIYIIPGQSKEINGCRVMHEYVHVLAACEWSDSDPEHVSTELWAGSELDSVEELGCRRLTGGG
jgi:hypothetical protein